jgi:hypothetical protein
MCLIPVAFVTGGELPITISFVDVNVISLHWESEHTELKSGGALGVACSSNRYLATAGITGTDRIWSTAHRNMSYTITNGNLMLFIPYVILQSIIFTNKCTRDKTHT